MDKDFLTELSPLTVIQSKIWHGISLALITAGAILMALGGWLLYQQQVAANEPPPAPIVNSLDLLPTLTPTRVPSPTAQPSPTATESKQQFHAVGDSIVLEPTETPTQTPSPTATAIPTLEPSPTSSPTPETITEPAGADANSLEGNPLIVGDSASTEIEAQPEPVASDNSAAQTVAPLNRLVADSINLDTPVVAVGWRERIQNGVTIKIWDVAEYAAGWHKNSYLPGQGGNIVLSGHHNIKGEVFRHTVDLEIGDIITLTMGDQPYSYTVTDKFIVKDKGEPQEVRIANARWIGPFDDERITMVTCWPYNNNTHRVIVIAKPAGSVPAADG